MKIKTKVFLDLLLVHSSDPRKVKRVMDKDMRLTRSEKKIIDCFMLMRANKNSEALVLIEEVQVQADPFVEAMRYFVKAGVLNNLNEHKKSLTHFLESYKHLPKGELIHFEFVTLLNIFNIFSSLRDYASAGKYLAKMQKMQGLNNDDSFLLDKSFLSFYILKEDELKASEYLKKIESNLAICKDHTLALIYLDMWDYGVTFKQFDVCDKALSKMKEQKNYILAEYYNYMKILLNHYVDNKPVYIVQTDYKNYPDLYMQLKLIRALETNQLSEAQALWDKLQMRKPHLFGKNFKMLGQRTILSLCIEKHQTKLSQTKKLAVRDEGKSILASIEEALVQNDEISKEDLFYFLYGRLPECKDDFNRLARDMYKFKMQKNLDVNSKKGVYSLVKKRA